MPRILTLLLAVFALAAFAGCGDDDESTSGSSGSATPAETSTTQTGAVPEPETAAGEVLMKGIMFKPKDITVKVGDTITWKNEDPVDHNAVDTATGKFESETFGEGGTFEYTAEEAGKIEYVCTLHPGMTGTITVE